MAKYIYKKYKLLANLEDLLHKKNNLLFVPYYFTYYPSIAFDVLNPGYYVGKNGTIIDNKVIADKHSFVGDFLVRDSQQEKHRIDSVKITNSDGVTFTTTVFKVNKSYSKGEYVGDIIAEDGSYPSNDYRGEFWYVKGGLANSPPAISGADADLGDKNTGFTVSYSVNDVDSADKLTVSEKINGQTIKTINNAPRNSQFIIEITEEQLYKFDLLTTNTIEIEVSDGQGNVVYRRYKFKRTNTAPKISGQDENLGKKTEGFNITFSATDQENDKMSAKIFINDKLVKTYESVVSGREYIYFISKLEFVQLNNIDIHKIRIEVQDHNNATSLRNYTFTRKLDRVMYMFKKETDIMATQILVSPTWKVAKGAVGKILVCNNAFDDVPTWEDATEQILLERHFNFTNKIKTANKWGVGVQITINKGTATELSYLAGFGGAFK